MGVTPFAKHSRGRENCRENLRHWPNPQKPNHSNNHTQKRPGLERAKEEAHPGRDKELSHHLGLEQTASQSSRGCNSRRKVERGK